jgi:hypothetical protein
MLPFTLDPFVALNRACVSEFGRRVPVQFLPQDGSGPYSINGIPQDPPILENGPYGNVTKPNSVVHLFVSYPDLSPAPGNGDILVIGGARYSMFDMGTDNSQGTFLKLRRLSA